ncbi:MAG: hypothetical protein NTZ94_02610 [Verrucomicrobia bacterium]|nr:hypothetical protein [Verrucomicrobiota bacterium]
MAPTIFVDFPAYSHKSNGVRCLYEMSLALAQKGIQVIGVPRNQGHFKDGLKHASQKIAALPTSPAPLGSAADLFLCAETVPLPLLKTARERGMRIAWWQLAPFGLLGKTQYPRQGEHLLPFSSYTQPDSHCYYQPPLDQAWAAALQSPRPARTSGPLKIALYPGKGRLRRLPASLLVLTRSSEVLLITRAHPETRAELFALLADCDGLISFDELSQLNLEAASLQIPVFLANRLFPDRCLETFSVQRLQEAVTGNPERFIHQVHQRHSTASKPWPQDDLLAANQATVSAIKGLIGRPTQQSLIREKSQLQQLKAYTRQLKQRRAIYANVNMAESGGTLALPDYLNYMKGTRHNDESILLKIRILDTTFKLVSKFRLTKISEITRRLNRQIHQPSDKPPSD